MSCYHPNLMEGRIDPSTGQVVYLFNGPATVSNPLDFTSFEDFPSKGSYQFLVPCGKCIGCRIDYSRTWANRMILELQDNPQAIFVTLTYNKSHVPFSDSGLMTLSVRDCQLFFKRLRKHFDDRRIRYYLSGEYGPKTRRPHYHAIIYGLQLTDFSDLRLIGYNKLNQAYYTSPLFESIWSNGFVQMSPVSYKTCAYVARYTMKKHYGEKHYYSKLGIHPEFSVCSRKPGIGMLNALHLVTSGNSTVAIDGKDGVYSFGLPKAFIRSVQHMNLSPEQVDVVSELCYNRIKLSETNFRSRLLLSEKTFEDYLRSEEARFAGKIKVLPERGDL